MADGGGWQNEVGLPAGNGARERFQSVLGEFAERLNSPQPMRRETAVALVQQMERLGRRMAADHDATLGRVAELDAALAALTARLEAQDAREAQQARQIDKLLADLAEARAARRPLIDARAVRTILAAAAACAALCGAGAGVVAITRPAAPEDIVAVPTVSPTVEPAAPELPVPDEAPVAITRPLEAPPPAAKPDVLAPRESYAVVAEALARGDTKAMPRLTGLAKAGDTKAQLRLAQLYEAGAIGLPRDLSAARFWTLKAATGGDTVAMYNAAQFLMEGDGGPQDLAGAASWFRRAGERGVVDAQYNLGLMYEVGRGVKRDPREALKWYARAAKAGDASAAQKLAELERGPEHAAPIKVEAVAVAPAVPDTGVRGASISETQAFLAQQGYYIGPVDGVVSPSLQAAATAYMRDRPIATAR